MTDSRNNNNAGSRTKKISAGSMRTYLSPAFTPMSSPALLYYTDLTPPAYLYPTATTPLTERQSPRTHLADSPDNVSISSREHDSSKEQNRRPRIRRISASPQSPRKNPSTLNKNPSADDLDFLKVAGEKPEKTKSATALETNDKNVSVIAEKTIKPLAETKFPVLNRIGTPTNSSQEIHSFVFGDKPKAFKEIPENSLRVNAEREKSAPRVSHGTLVPERNSAGVLNKNDPKAAIGKNRPRLAIQVIKLC